MICCNTNDKTLTLSYSNKINDIILNKNLNESKIFFIYS